MGNFLGGNFYYFIDIAIHLSSMLPIWGTMGTSFFTKVMTCDILRAEAHHWFLLFLATALTDLDTPTINKLLTALNECTEWGQVFILDSLATYTPTDPQEAQNICERVTPRLSHANAAVVLSAVKVLMKFMESLPSDSDYLDQITKKLAPPLGEPSQLYDR